MKKILVGLALALLSSSALAADNALTVTVGAGTTLRSKDVGVGVQAPSAILVDQTGVFIGAFSNFGTTPGTVPVPGVNASIIGTPAVSQSGTWNIGTVTTLSTITNPVAATQSGAWTTNPTTPANWALAATAAAVPANAIYNGMNVGGNLVGLTGTGTNLNVNCQVGCGGAGSVSNATSGVATSSTNIGAVSWLYGFNGTTWDQLKVDTTLTNHGLYTFVTNANPNSRTTSANSSPVVPSAAPTTLHLIAAASTNATSQKASATTLLSCQFSNNSTTAGYFKVYNKASSPTVGTDVPVVTAIIPGPAAGGGGSNIQFGPGGLALATGFAFAVTNGIADTDNVAVAAATFAINCQYE